MSGPSVNVSAVGAVSPLGIGIAPLLHALHSGETAVRNDAPVSRAFPGQPAAELDALPAPTSRKEAKARRMMSRGAALAAIATRDLLAQGPLPAPLDDTGFFMGVGPSGGDLSQIAAMLRAGQDGAAFDLHAFGAAGLAATHPLLGFQLMNNFTLCHAAVLEGIRGPNLALFSRGGGTWAALEEALWAMSSGECDQALVGGADAATHLTTWAELLREGADEEALVPGEGAAVVALQLGGSGPRVVEARRHPSDGRLPVLRDPRPVVVLAAAAGSANEAWRERLAPLEVQFDVSSILGETLAGGPALAWAAGAALLRARGEGEALVVAEGPDGDAGWLHLDLRPPGAKG